MQLAQLGFIVIQVGHRGGSRTRSKAYHSYGYFNLRDYGLADKKAAIEQLAARHPFIDIDRVGIYGHSGGGFMSAAARAAEAVQRVLQGRGRLGRQPRQQHLQRQLVRALPRPEGSRRSATAQEGRPADDRRGRRPAKAPADEEGRRPRTRSRPRRRRRQDADEDETDEAEKNDSDRGRSEGRGEEGRGEGRDEKDADARRQARSRGDEGRPPKTKFEIKVPTNAELAANLKGHLLLVHGEIDNNVHPANTMRLVDALIKANKRFDMLIIPGKRARLRRRPAVLHAADVGLLRRAPARRPADRGGHQRQGREAEVVGFVEPGASATGATFPPVADAPGSPDLPARPSPTGPRSRSRRPTRSAAAQDDAGLHDFAPLLRIGRESLAGQPDEPFVRAADDRRVLLVELGVQDLRRAPTPIPAAGTCPDRERPRAAPRDPRFPRPRCPVPPPPATDREELHRLRADA